MSKKITPAEFDIDAWIEGATRPSRSVKVFQRGDLLADLDELAEEIRVAEAIPEAEQSLAASPGRLRAKFEKLAEQFHDSGLTIRLHGHTREERESIGEGYDLTIPAQKLAAGRAVLADAIDFPVMTADQVGKMRKRIGDPQFSKIIEAHNDASSAILSPSADFLPKRSTEEKGDEA